jgi:hypothetical protein
MPKPLVSGLGPGGDTGGHAGNKKLTISRRTGFSMIPSPFLRQMVAVSPCGIGQTDATSLSRWT